MQGGDACLGDAGSLMHACSWHGPGAHLLRDLHILLVWSAPVSYAYRCKHGCVKLGAAGCQVQVHIVACADKRKGVQVQLYRLRHRGTGTVWTGSLGHRPWSRPVRVARSAVVSREHVRSTCTFYRCMLYSGVSCSASGGCGITVISAV